MKHDSSNRRPKDSAAPPRSRGRPKVAPDADQARAIAETAWRLFIEKGYAGTTMGDVAATARVSLRTVYHLFPAKPDLFAAVVDLHRQTMLALPGDNDDLPVDQALGRIFQLDLDPETEKARAALMTFFIVEGRQFPELGPLVRKHGAEKSGILLAEWLEGQHRAGRIHAPDPRIAAKMLMDVVFGAVALKSGKGPEWAGSDDRKSYLESCFAMISTGLTPRAASNHKEMQPLQSDHDSKGFTS